MVINDLDTWGTPIPVNDLSYARSKEIALSTQSLPYFSILNAYKGLDNNGGKVEILVIEVEPEIPQRKINDIRRKEQIALFVQHENYIPEVFALRKDFPSVPHINLRSYSHPKSLCIYDNSEEERIRFAPGRFLEDIRTWFSRTSVASLHQVDQPLEPFALTHNPRLIIPRTMLIQASNKLYYDAIIRRLEDSSGISALICKPATEKDSNLKESIFRFVNIIISPQTQSTINIEPKNFIELRNLIKPKGIDILDTVRNSLNDYIQNNPPNKRPDSLVILLRIPRCRSLNSEAEDIETWVFWLRPDIKFLGSQFGIWELQDNQIAGLVPVDTTRTGDEIDIISLNTCIAFDQNLAKATSGYQSYPNYKFVLVGCGAIGSQVFINIARMGIGNWTLIDDDIVLPHNFARHAALPGFEGVNKAEALASMTQNFSSNGPFKFIRGKIDSISGMNPEITKALDEADIIIDATTSITASRFLSTYDGSKARRLSIFINPKGTDAVLFLEDNERTVPLNTLEMQYYRLICENEQMQNHLSKPSGGLRYSNSCRDFSFILPQSQVASFSGILSGAIVRLLQQNESLISIWKLDIEKWSTTNIQMKGRRPKVIDSEEWNVSIDEGFLEKIKNARQTRLPNETGGVILGTYDTSKKYIYVVDTILSPVDSIERRTSYIRGKQGLKEEVEKVRNKTLGQVEYLGEWHSHPKNASADPSDLDFEVLRWIGDNMQPFGLPGIVIIVADNDQFSLMKIHTSIQNQSDITTVTHKEFGNKILLLSEIE